MTRLAICCAAWVVFAVAVAAIATLPALAAEGSSAGMVTLETGGASGITIRLAEDLADLVNDGANRRILPVVGHGGVRNIADLVQTPGIDLAILQLDVLEYARTQNMFPGIANSISYIAKLNYVEFHLLARLDVASVAALAGKTVSAGPRLGNTAITTGQLFKLLNVPATLTDDEPDIAIEKLRRGEIGAVAFVGGKPAPLLRMLPPQGLHLLSIPLSPEVIGSYIPTWLSATEYPGLIAAGARIDTVAVGTGLFVRPVTAGSDDDRKIAAVVDAFFSLFPALLTPGHHAKWAEVNLSSEIPGWHRLPYADDWLKRSASTVAGLDLKTAFLRFLDERDKAIGRGPMSQEQKDALFDQFRRWQNTVAQSTQAPAGKTH